MRIIAGKYKRITLDTLDGDDITRPTKDMVKEALFDSLQITSDESFLDLFSGSGAIGIEAISRGAKEVVLNDINKDAYKIILKNLRKINEYPKVLNMNYDLCLKSLANYNFDYIYIDPPYAFKEYNKIFEYVNEYNLISKKGIMIVEVRKDVDLDLNISNFEQYKNKKYGITKLLYYRKVNNND